MPKISGEGRRPLGAIVRLLAVAAFSTSIVIGAGAAHADAPVVVGEVSTTTGHEEVVPVVRDALVTELSAVKVPQGKKFIVSAALTKLETKGTTTSCVISLALRDASGTLKGVLLGSGDVVGKRDEASTRAAIDAAVRGATKGLPAVVSQ
jgi:hypothetical protein